MNTVLFVFSENLFLVYSVVVIILDEQIFLTYVLNCQEGSKSKEQVSGPKVDIGENFEETISSCDLEPVQKLPNTELV